MFDMAGGGGLAGQRPAKAEHAKANHAKATHAETKPPHEADQAIRCKAASSRVTSSR